VEGGALWLSKDFGFTDNLDVESIIAAIKAPGHIHFMR
jgi:hypothetical protein